MSSAELRGLLQDAVVHHRAGRLTEAEELYARVRAEEPASFDALHLSGVVALQQARYTQALDLLRQALELRPDSALCEVRLGIVLGATGDVAGAEKRFRNALEHEENLVEAWIHLGALLRSEGRLSEAHTACARVAELDSENAEAHDALGTVVSEATGFADAVPHFRRAVALDPALVGAWARLGWALARSGGVDEALTCFNRALALEATNSPALAGRAFVFQETHRVAEAVGTYDQVLEKNPQYHEARSARLFALHHGDRLSREQIFREHVAFGTAIGEPPLRPLPNNRDPARRLNLAFLSPDLRSHSVAYFLEPLLAHLDRSQFRITLYHDHPRLDTMSARLRMYAAVWRHFAGLPHHVVEKAIRTDQPDILVDLAGHSDLNRQALFARRLAPVQVTYLGYPDTTGLQAMDYRFVDETTDPVGSAEKFNTESLVRFAPTMWAYRPPMEAPEPRKREEGEPVTFGCFNSFSKVSDSTLRGWARVLTAVPNSRLLLKSHGLGEARQQTRIKERLARFDVAPERVELLGRTSGLTAHLDHYAKVDVALDTFPYHGTTTTCEALWMGVPVVTLAGDHHMARVGASLLQAGGHPEWVARDWDDYVRIALELAADAPQRAKLRTRLRADLRHGPLLDHAGQAARFGAALRQCWTDWCARSAP